MQRASEGGSESDANRNAHADIVERNSDSRAEGGPERHISTNRNSTSHAFARSSPPGGSLRL
jgi:hypothetical protein